MIQGKENLDFAKDLLIEWTERNAPDARTVSDIEEAMYWNADQHRYEVDFGFLNTDCEAVQIYTGDYAVQEILAELEAQGEVRPEEAFNEFVDERRLVAYISEDHKLYWLLFY